MNRELTPGQMRVITLFAIIALSSLGGCAATLGALWYVAGKNLQRIERAK